MMAFRRVLQSPKLAISGWLRCHPNRIPVASLRACALVAACLTLATSGLTFLSLPAQANNSWLGYSLTAGETMNPGDFIVDSLNPISYYLIMQSDGNLVQYTYPGGIALWASGTP